MLDFPKRHHEVTVDLYIAELNEEDIEYLLNTLLQRLLVLDVRMPSAIGLVAMAALLGC